MVFHCNSSCTKAPQSHVIRHTFRKTTTWRQCVKLSFIVMAVKNRKLGKASKICTDLQDVSEQFYLIESLHPPAHTL